MPIRKPVRSEPLPALGDDELRALQAACRKAGWPSNGNVLESLLMLGMARKLGVDLLPAWPDDLTILEMHELLKDSFKFAVQLLAPRSIPVRGRGRPMGSRSFTAGERELARRFVLQQVQSNAIELSFPELRKIIRNEEQDGGLLGKQLGERGKVIVRGQDRVRGAAFDKLKPLVQLYWSLVQPNTLVSFLAARNRIASLVRRQALIRAVLQPASRQNVEQSGLMQQD